MPYQSLMCASKLSIIYKRKKKCTSICTSLTLKFLQCCFISLSKLNSFLCISFVTFQTTLVALEVNMVSRQTDRISQPWATTVRRRSPSTPHRPTWARVLAGNSVSMPKIKTRSDYFLWNQFLNPWNCMFSESWFLLRTYYLGI